MVTLDSRNKRCMIEYCDLEHDTIFNFITKSLENNKKYKIRLKINRNRDRNKDISCDECILKKNNLDCSGIGCFIKGAGGKIVEIKD